MNISISNVISCFTELFWTIDKKVEETKINKVEDYLDKDMPF
jgi:hypothetical protein